MRVVEEASITAPIPGSNLSEDEIVLPPGISASLLAALVALRAAVVAVRTEEAMHERITPNPAFEMDAAKARRF